MLQNFIYYFYIRYLMATSMTRQIVVNQEIAICSKYSNIIICEWFNNNRQIIVVNNTITSKKTSNNSRISQNTIKINKIAVTTKNVVNIKIKKIAQKIINKRSDSRSNRFNDIRNNFINKMFEITDDGSHVRRKRFAIARTGSENGRNQAKNQAKNESRKFVKHI